MRIWPWSELSLLRRELRATRLACSAEAKKVNRLIARINTLDRALEKHHAQERHDQEYADLLEARLAPEIVAEVRSDITGGAV